ncbi:hypothetical protein AV530_011557 [Patagioenas fasciata monilis]|uniref:Uncharacterized protein n=1 Tax=Patagioenas fasciata monilis TaxID=372326 RepID=A0A1V4JQ27_PATFA|nr:hypothetical protein AV530_011557 [Patagioenas fasciata monilis]
MERAGKSPGEPGSSRTAGAREHKHPPPAPSQGLCCSHLWRRAEEVSELCGAPQLSHWGERSKAGCLNTSVPGVSQLRFGVLEDDKRIAL